VLLGLVATLCAGVFAGAAIYITLVEHPARLECGTAAAVAEFTPSYRRAARLQASLAAMGSLSAVAAWWQGHGSAFLTGGLLLGSVIPFTLLVILPTNRGCSIPRWTPRYPRRRSSFGGGAGSIWFGAWRAASPFSCCLPTWPA
jgi:hypothetical protein